MTDLKKKALQHPVCGLLVKVSDSLAHPVIASQIGLDFLFYDLEHGVINDERLLELCVMGNACGIPSVVRAPQLARKDVSRTLDSGASGIMVPMIETADQARQLVQWACYPPLGKRSYSGGANTMFAPGGHHRENMDAANESNLVLAQIETLEGAKNLEEILEVEGIDGVIVGPCDLGISMDNPDNMHDPRELALIDSIAAKAHKAGKLFGLIGPASVMQALSQPTDLVVCAIDTNLMRKGMQEAVGEFESLVSGFQKGDAHE